MIIFQAPPAPTTAAQVVVTAKPSRPVGTTTLRCAVTVVGDLENCEVASEDPAGAGLAASALRLVTRFKVKPTMREGHPVAGSLLVPFRFQMASDDEPADTPTPRPPIR